MSWADQWANTVRESVAQLGTTVAGFIPNVLGMLVILVVGYVLSSMFGRVAGSLLGRFGFDRAGDRIGLSRALERGGLALTPSRLVGRLVFWFFMLTFLVSAAETLGLQTVSSTIDSFVAYLPNVMGAAIISVVGLLLAGVVRDVVRSAAAGIGVEYAGGLAKLAHGTVIVLIASLAIGQLGIQATLVNRVVEIVLIAAGAAVALTLGFGSRDVARHVVAGVYARDVFVSGMRVAVGDAAGTVEEVGTVATRIRTRDGKAIFVPNGTLIETTVHGDLAESDPL